VIGSDYKNVYSRTNAVMTSAYVLAVTTSHSTCLWV